jgi:molybdopterin/thiamine biosynthesis adenylyltransferase
MQALEAIKVLCNYGKSNVNKLVMFDGMTSSWQSFKARKNASCSVCN